MDQVITKTSLEKFIIQVLVKNEISQQEAAEVANVLLQADLWGISSHGISRLKRYLMRLEDGTIKRHPQLVAARTFPALLAVDGDNGLGAVVMHYALRQAIEQAQQYGICAVGVKNSNHFGVSGYYCREAARHGLIAIGFSNALAAMAPWGGKRAFLGTNPLAFGFPRDNAAPIIIDMATSTVARGKILMAIKKGLNIPSGWAMDRDGIPTTDAQKAADGLILPMAGPKGYALAMAVDILSGICTGSFFGDQAGAYKNDPTAARIGHFFVLLRCDAFLTNEDYNQRIETFCKNVQSVEKADGTNAIYLPGEREYQSELQQLSDGILVPESILKELQEIGKRYQVDLQLN